MSISKENLGLIPLWNFGEIVPNLYRSAQPQWSFQYEWLYKNLGVESIVNLRKESQHDQKIVVDNMIPIGITQIDVVDHQPPTIEQAQDYIKLIKSSRNPHFINPQDRLSVPTLIHCEHGHGRTSTFSVLAKVALGMSMDDAIKDEKERFHYEFRHHAQEAWLRDNEKVFLG